MAYNYPFFPVPHLPKKEKEKAKQKNYQVVQRDDGANERSCVENPHLEESNIHVTCNLRQFRVIHQIDAVTIFFKGNSIQ